MNPYNFQPETWATLKALDPQCVDRQSHQIGMNNNEPLIVMLDSLLRYARAYVNRYEQPLASDHVLGAAWLDTIRSLHGLLDGDGAVALEMDRSTDSKSNGACESLYWTCIHTAGFTEAEVV